jgi:hypothetical protein
MKKPISAVLVALAVLAMLLPVMNAVKPSISNVAGPGQVLVAEGNPQPLPPVPPARSEGNPQPLPPVPPIV